MVWWQPEKQQNLRGGQELYKTSDMDIVKFWTHEKEITQNERLVMKVKYSITQ